MEINEQNIIVKRKNKVVYRDDKKIVKLFNKNYSKADILNEALIHARVEEGTDLNIPKFLEIDTIDGKIALVNECVEGETLACLMDKNKDKFDEYMELFIKIQLEILSKDVPTLTRIKDKFRGKLTQTKILDENAKYELLQRLEGMKNHTKLCHGDFDPSNVIIDKDGKYHIIDWAHATRGNASADAARTYLLICLEYGEENAKKYLELFSKKSGIDEKNIQRWIPIVAAIQIMKNEDDREMLQKWIDVVDFE